MRTIIIGDIHGCSLQLMGLLDQLKPNPEEDHLIFLGDLFDRGPDSWGVFQIVKITGRDISGVFYTPQRQS